MVLNGFIINTQEGSLHEAMSFSSILVLLLAAFARCAGGFEVRLPASNGIVRPRTCLY